MLQIVEHRKGFLIVVSSFCLLSMCIIKQLVETTFYGTASPDIRVRGTVACILVQSLVLEFNSISFCFVVSRKLEDLSKVCEEKTEEFKQLEQQDTRIREDMRHANVQIKKLEKTLQQEQKKVLLSLFCFQFLS
jgi:hypothetical protein